MGQHTAETRGYALLEWAATGEEQWLQNLCDEMTYLLYLTYVRSKQQVAIGIFTITEAKYTLV